MSILQRAAVAACLTVLPIASARAALKTYDGRWNVSLVRESGVCGTDRFNYTVAIQNGSMRYLPKPGEAAPSFHGTVAGDGSAIVHSVFKGADVEAVGSLQERRGSGTWQASLFGCAGTWRARRIS